MNLRKDSLGGEIRAKSQRVGEYVPETDAAGKDIPEYASTHRERHPLQPVKKNKLKSILKNKQKKNDPIFKQRLRISKIARRKPVPTMWLANYEFYDIIREYKAERAKSRAQKQAEAAAKVKTYWERRAKKLPPEKPKRAPFKHPANH